MYSLKTSGRVAMLLAGAFLLCACQTPPEKDPTWQKVVEIDGRVLSIERVVNNQSLLDLSRNDEALRAELRAVRGQLEELQHNLDVMRAQQKDLYADLDKRITAAEKVRAVPLASPAAQMQDRDAYQAAFNLLKDGKYAEAEAAFAQFMTSYPQSQLLDNAQYWLGESHYVLKDFPQAQRDFQSVLDNYPNSGKLPDALLKLGFTQYELKSYQGARSNLQRVLDQFPESNAAKLAQQRLAKMTAEGH